MVLGGRDTLYNVDLIDDFQNSPYSHEIKSALLTEMIDSIRWDLLNDNMSINLLRQ